MHLSSGEDLTLMTTVTTDRGGAAPSANPVGPASVAHFRGPAVLGYSDQ